MDWKKVEDHGVPHDATGDDVIYVGVNSAGYCGCFNAVGTPDGGETWDAFYETAEDYTRILGDLKLWAVLDVPNAEHDRRTAALSPGVRVDGPVGHRSEE